MTLEELYKEYKNLVFNLALQYVQNTEDAEEITQDTFVAVYQSISMFKAESKISTWIYRITINKSLDFIKAKNRKKRFAFFTSLFHEDSNEVRYDKASFDHPGVQLENKEAIETIFNHINKLPANQKTALLLNKLEGKRVAEIGEIMGFSNKAVESLIQRAKANLAKKIDNNEGIE